MGMYIKDEEEMKERIKSILDHRLEVKKGEITQRSIEIVSNSIMLMISAEMRNQKLGIEQPKCNCKKETCGII